MSNRLYESEIEPIALDILRDENGTTQKIVIKNETKADVAVISEVTIAAFRLIELYISTNAPI